jgi:hypothetical protein
MFLSFSASKYVLGRQALSQSDAVLGHPLGSKDGFSESLVCITYPISSLIIVEATREGSCDI